MPVIKRYPNRKLYDTEAKQYITLEGIAALIRQGKEIQVIDYTNEEDLTAVTLTQIIFEQEKRKGGFLPKSVLTGLVQAGGDTLNSLRRSLTSPLELLKHVDEQIDHRLQTLVTRGEMAKEEAQHLREKLLSKNHPDDDARILSLPGQQYLERLLSKRGLPTQDEVAQLTEQIETLSAKLDALLAESEQSSE